MKKLAVFILVVFLCFPALAFSGTRALQFDVLLTPVIDYTTFAVASGYTVYFYAAGTSTAKNVWTEKEKTNAYTSRTIGSDGTVQVYGDGIYKLIIKNADSTTIYEWDNVKVQANTYTLQDKADTYTATADDDIVLIDTTTGNKTIYLSTVVNFTHPIAFQHKAGSNTVTIDASPETFDASGVTITLTADDDNALLYPDVASLTWRRINRFSGLTTTVTELNQLDGVTVAGDASGDLVTTDGAQTLQNKTLTSPVLNASVSGTAVLDEDAMTSDSATQLVTQQSVKAHVASYSPLLMDGSEGLVLRRCKVEITDSPTASSALYTLTSTGRFNSSASQVVTLAKSGSSNNVSLDATGGVLTIGSENLEGNVVMAMGYISLDCYGTQINAHAQALNNDLVISYTLSTDQAAGNFDTTDVNDDDAIYVEILYVTDQ